MKHILINSVFYGIAGGVMASQGLYIDIWPVWALLACMAGVQLNSMFWASK